MDQSGKAVVIDWIELKRRLIKSQISRPPLAFTKD